MQRKFSVFKIGIIILVIFGIEFAVLGGLIIRARIESSDPQRLMGEKKIAQVLLLTDFCFVTESRHTRHISQPEPIAPFQDLPGFHEHFPSSTFLQPPLHIYQDRLK